MFASGLASLAFSLCLAFQDQSPAQSPPLKHELVVTASRIEQPAREVASSFTILKKADLDLAGRASVFDALQGVAGLALVRTGGPGETSSLMIRGANSEHALVMLDGVPLNDPVNPSRNFDFAHLTLDGLDRIEILRGPQSPLYGSDALGGVVNLLTARGQGRPRLSLRAAGGSYATADTGFDLRGSAGAVHYAFGLSRFSAGGISAAGTDYPGNGEPDGYRNITLFGRFGAVMKNGLEFDLIARAVSARTELDNFGGAYGDDPNHRQEYGSASVRAQARFLMADGRWEQKTAVSLVRSKRETDNPADDAHPFDAEKGRFESLRGRIEWQNNLFLLPGQTLSFGADLDRETGESEYRSESLWGPYESVFPRSRADRVGLYVQDRAQWGKSFFASFGLRYDHYGRAGRALTYRLAPAYILERTGTKFKATIGTGFKAPSLYQLHAPGTAWGPIGNPDLASERCFGWDAGLEQSLLNGRISLGATVFHNDLENLIDFDYALGYINIGKAATRGLEASAEARPNERVSARLSYTRLDARDRTRDAPLPRRPRDSAAFSLQSAFAKKWDAGLSVVYIGPRPDRDYAAYPSRDLTLAGYALIGANLSFRPASGVQLFVRFDNILDARYESVYGYGTPGFSAFGGLRLNI